MDEIVLTRHKDCVGSVCFTAPAGSAITRLYVRRLTPGVDHAPAVTIALTVGAVESVSADPVAGVSPKAARAFGLDRVPPAPIPTGAGAPLARLRALRRL